MFHPREFAVAFVSADSALPRLCAERLSLAEAAAWLESHRRAPSPDGQPCIVLDPVSPAFRRAEAGPRSGTA